MVFGNTWYFLKIPNPHVSNNEGKVNRINGEMLVSNLNVSRNTTCLSRLLSESYENIQKHDSDFL